MTSVGQPASVVGEEGAPPATAASRPRRWQRLLLSWGWAPGLLLAAVVASTGPVRQTQFPNDVTTFLDACQRLCSGQLMHVDFHSPLGPVAFLPYAVAMNFTGANVAALPWGSALSLGFFSLWAWWLARSRVSPVHATLLALFIGLLAGTAYTLDFGSWRQPSYSMTYNRIGWALFCLIAVEGVLPAPARARGWMEAGGVSSGAALALLLLLKANFGAVAVILFVSLTLLERRPLLPRLAGSAAGAVATAAGVYLLVPYSLGGYLGEIAGMGRLQSASTFVPLGVRLLEDNAVWLLGLAAGLVALRGLRLPSPEFWTLSLGATLIVGAGLVISLTNCQFAELPSFSVTVWLLGRRLRAALPGDGAGHRWLALAGAPLLWMAGVQAASVVHGAAWRQLRADQLPANAQIDSPAYRALPMPAWPDDREDTGAAALTWEGGEASPYAFAQWVNDGLGLLRGRSGPQSRILCMDWSNPFPFALGLPPPKHDHIAWHWGRVVGDRHHVAPALLFADADLVMVPRLGAQPESIAAKLRVYGPELEKQFTPVAATAVWTLWARRAAP